ncbi:MAG: Arm DNA-binding domain-containing protein [bacterium]|nr:Arm DNA-binding domain-containing protein [bacterium]
MLTYIQINAAKPREKAWTLSDSESLYLVIQPNGSKLWRFNCRFLNKQEKLHLGGWPTTSLAEARVRRDEAKKKIAEGIDPALEKKRARIAAKYTATNTFEVLAEEWLVKCERDGLPPTSRPRALLANRLCKMQAQ